MRSDLMYAYFSVLSCCLLVASKKPEETVLRPPPTPALPCLERATPRPEQAPPMSRPSPEISPFHSFTLRVLSFNYVLSA